MLEPLDRSGSTLTAGEIGKRNIAALATFPMAAKEAFCVEENPKVCSERQIDQPSFAGNLNRRCLDVGAGRKLHATPILRRIMEILKRFHGPRQIFSRRKRLVGRLETGKRKSLQLMVRFGQLSRRHASNRCGSGRRIEYRPFIREDLECVGASIDNPSRACLTESANGPIRARFVSRYFAAAPR